MTKEQTETVITPESVLDMVRNTFHLENEDDVENILKLIVSSFTDEYCSVMYKYSPSSYGHKEFRENIRSAAIHLLGKETDDLIKVLRKGEYSPVFKLCKTIHKAYKQDNHFVVNLFREPIIWEPIEKPKKCEWVEPEIANIMFTEFDKVIKNDLKMSTDDKFSICDPCMGSGELIKYYVKNYPNASIHGCDDDRITMMNMKMDLMLKGYDISFLHNENYLKVKNNELTSDITICNPPYGRNTIKGGCLQYLVKALQHSKYVCFIIPKCKFNIEKKEFTEIVNYNTILKIINIGDIYKNGNPNNEIIILIARSGKHDIKTKYVDYHLIAREYRHVYHSMIWKFNKKGNTMLQNLYADNVDMIEYTPTEDEPYPVIKNLPVVDRVKANIIEKYKALITDMGNFQYMADTRKQFYVSSINEDIDRLQKCETISEIMNMITGTENKDASKEKEIRVLDYFDIVKYKQAKLDYVKPGEYPLYGSSKDAEPIKYVSEYTIDTNGEKWLHINKIGSIGHSFIRQGKFALYQDHFILKPKDEHKNAINLDENIDIITFQFSNMGFSCINTLNTEKLNDLSIRVYM